MLTEADRTRMLCELSPAKYVEIVAIALQLIALFEQRPHDERVNKGTCLCGQSLDTFGEDCGFGIDSRCLRFKQGDQRA